MKLRTLVVSTALAASACTGGDGNSSATTISTLPTTTANTAPATTISTLPTTTANTAPFSSLTWSRVPHDEAVFGGEGLQVMESVTAGGPGLVAVGREGPGGDRDAAVWTSPDGITWSRVLHDEAVFGGDGRQVMNSVTIGGPGLVAVGWDGSGNDRDAAVWTSADGITWSRVLHDETVLGGEGRQEMESVTAGGPGLVAVGRDEASVGDLNAAVWTSADGITWSRVPHDEAVLGGDGQQLMVSVTAGGPGLVAVGFYGLSGRRDAAVWTSADGITWSRVPDDQGVLGGDGRQLMNGVTAGGPGLVAIGTDRFQGAVWISPDGITWSQVPDDEVILGSRMGSVTAGGSGLVAVGTARSSRNVAVREPGSEDYLVCPGFVCDETDAAVWTSPDGITWSRVPHDARVFGGEGRQPMNSVTAGGPGLVAVGFNELRLDLAASVWVAATEN